MKRLMICVAATAVALSGWMAWAQKPAEAEPNFWMKKKLESSQHILAGLATADFDQISKSAKSMNNLTQIERWTRRTNAEEYRTQLRVFRFANEDLVREADKKNIEGVSLAFSQLTLSCVNCHKLIRDADKSDSAAKAPAKDAKVDEAAPK